MTTDQEGAEPIRTPDQRLRVFVSSTLAELAPERGGSGEGDLGAPADPGDVRARGPSAPTSRALPRLSGTVRRVRRSVLAALRVDRARDGHLRPRGRVPSLRRHAPAAVPEVAGAGAGARIGGDDRRHPVGGSGLLPIVPHHARARPARSRRPGAASQRAVRDAGPDRGSIEYIGGEYIGGHRHPAAASLVADALDLLGRS